MLKAFAYLSSIQDYWKPFTLAQSHWRNWNNFKWNFTEIQTNSTIDGENKRRTLWMNQFRRIFHRREIIIYFSKWVSNSATEVHGIFKCLNFHFTFFFGNKKECGEEKIYRNASICSKTEYNKMDYNFSFCCLFIPYFPLRPTFTVKLWWQRMEANERI